MKRNVESLTTYKSLKFFSFFSTRKIVIFVSWEWIANFSPGSIHCTVEKQQLLTFLCIRGALSIGNISGVLLLFQQKIRTDGCYFSLDVPFSSPDISEHGGKSFFWQAHILTCPSGLPIIIDNLICIWIVSKKIPDPDDGIEKGNIDSLAAWPPSGNWV